MATVTPIGDGFTGGSKTTLGRPDIVSGTLAPANVASSIIGGVSPGEQRSARGDRGTNVTIPYARVVFHAGASTALPRRDQSTNKDVPTPFGLNGVLPNRESISETDYMGAGTIGFILGRRGKTYEDGVAAVMGLDTTGNPIFSREQNRLAQFALVGGGVDTNSAQRMCSIEYLDSYFFHVLRKKAINLGGAITDEEYSHLKLRWGKVNAGLNANAARVVPKGFDYEAVAGRITGAAVAFFAGEGKRQGVYAGDMGPFLRGYTIDRTIVEGTTLSAGFGDQVAFDILQQRLMEQGICDWTPDGVVHSKLSSGDSATDYEMDARDGQLFNVVVSGSAITVSWTYDQYRDVMPGDQLFVVLVGDVWETADDQWDTTADPTKTPDQWYTERKENMFAPGEEYDQAVATTRFGTVPGEIYITNIRPRLITSTEMMQYSAVTTTKSTIKSDRTSRLGLRASKGCREYIVGGWSIGNVVDNSASRPVEDRSAMGVAKRSKTSHACNVLVNIRWWSADRMFRTFMNKEGTLQTRFDGYKKVVENNENKPATKR